MELQQFISAHDGRFLDLDGVYGGQCVDLANAWVQNLGLQMFYGNAVDFWEQSPADFHKVAYGGNNAPSPGDIVVWGYGVGPFGHVAVAIEASAQSFRSFDQNWPLSTPCHRQPHDYRGVLGWFSLPAATDKTGPGEFPNTFYGTVRTGGGDAVVRRLPGTDQAQIKSLEEGMRVGVDRWCHHPPALVVNEGWPPDDRWYHLYDGSDGWMASAVVYGDPQNGCQEVPDPALPASPTGQWTARAEAVRIRAQPSTGAEVVRQTGIEVLTFDAYCRRRRSWIPGGTSRTTAGAGWRISPGGRRTRSSSAIRPPTRRSSAPRDDVSGSAGAAS